MKIVLACGAMPFGPHTPMFRSLGGSETAALMLGKALAARGHEVSMFCNLQQDGPDAFAGGKADDGVFYHGLDSYSTYVTGVQHDLLIAVRDPRMVVLPVQAKKKVLWTHDIATKRGMQRAFDQMAWAFDEVWAVSEWHRKQIHEATGYPLHSIKALRNGIVPVPDVEQGSRIAKQLIYAARPERGLENLIKPGGVMEHLPEFKLKVAMYEHFPEDMRGFYEMIFARIKEVPNVELIGGKSQPQMRQIIADSEAYIYPTQFEETSCILARECIEQGTPFLTTREGALPETLGDCGLYFEDWYHEIALRSATEGGVMLMPEKGSLEWCKLFAQFVRETLNSTIIAIPPLRMAKRTDLYWDGVALMVEANAKPKQSPLFSRVWSLIQDGDVIAARALMQATPQPELTEPLASLYQELVGCYGFIEGDMGQYYEDSYTKKQGTDEDELIFRLDTNKTKRWIAIADQIRQLPPGSRVLEYGCGPGHVLAPLAKEFPAITFVGTDHSEAALSVVDKGAQEHGLKNLVARRGPFPDAFDAVICTEVLEHVVRPWELLAQIEGYVKLGGKVIVTCPRGPWEPKSYQRPGHWGERFHLWSIDQVMFKQMTGNKPKQRFLHLNDGMDDYMRVIGHTVMTYEADHKPILSVDPLDKANRAWSRQTVAACVIAYNNEDTILKMLNSLEGKVQFIQIAMGPCTDNTRRYVLDWFRDRPWVRFKIIDVPKIEPRKFGFDDARNASFAGVADDFDWFLWIDTDEYLAGSPLKYLLNSALDGYMLAQHHFTVEPRGKPPEIDRPARLCRTNRGYVAKGHIHEHFEVPEGGPGMCQMLPDIDIGHPGYVNEATRRARFLRNFPFLEWDHETGGDRKLHKFLWFRDIIHRMRFKMMENATVPVVRGLAEEAIAYYNANVEDMSAFGPGIYMSVAYLSEAYKVLGRGVFMKFALGFDDRGTQLEGVFESPEQFYRVIKQLIDPEFKDRQSKYY
jgi:SAM-dependent methyltransferase/glycosyltransferase involved in cell wall biosynthesis